MTRQLNQLVRHVRQKVEVTGRPRRWADYLEVGVCRMRWLAAVGIAILLIHVGLEWLDPMGDGAHERQWLHLILLDFIPIAALVGFLITAVGRMSMKRAEWLAVGTVGVMICSTAVACGMLSAEPRMQVLPPLAIMLLVGLLILPARLAALIGLAAVGIGVALGVSLIVLSMRDAGYRPLTEFWYPTAMAVLGIAINQWFARNYRSMWKSQRTLCRRARQLDRDRQEIQRLLGSVLPYPVSQQLRQTGRFRSNLEEVCVISCDIVGFTRLCRELPAQSVVEELRRFFRAFDRCSAPHRIEPLRSQGDGVLGIGGLWPECETERRRPVIDALLAVLSFQRCLRDKCDEASRLWPARMGVHVGPVVMGVIDGQRLSFDVWGDTVNIAAGLQQGAEPNQILVTDRALWTTRGLFEYGPLHELTVKSTHMPAVAEVYAIASAYRNDDGSPNERFWQVYRADEYPLIAPRIEGTMDQATGPLKMPATAG